MKLTELKNEDAIEALADLIEPIAELGQDPEVVNAIKSGHKINVIQVVLRNHAKAIFNILARVDGVPPEEYECNVMTLPAKLLHLIDMPEFSFLFPAQGQMMESSDFGSAMENIEDGTN